MGFVSLRKIYCILKLYPLCLILYAYYCMYPLLYCKLNGTKIIFEIDIEDLNGACCFCSYLLTETKELLNIWIWIKTFIPDCDPRRFWLFIDQPQYVLKTLLRYSIVDKLLRACGPVGHLTTCLYPLHVKDELMFCTCAV